MYRCESDVAKQLHIVESTLKSKQNTLQKNKVLHEVALVKLAQMTGLLALAKRKKRGLVQVLQKLNEKLNLKPNGVGLPGELLERLRCLSPPQGKQGTSPKLKYAALAGKEGSTLSANRLTKHIVSTALHALDLNMDLDELEDLVSMLAEEDKEDEDVQAEQNKEQEAVGFAGEEELVGSLNVQPMTSPRPSVPISAQERSLVTPAQREIPATNGLLEEDEEKSGMKDIDIDIDELLRVAMSFESEERPLNGLEETAEQAKSWLASPSVSFVSSPSAARREEAEEVLAPGSIRGKGLPWTDSKANDGLHGLMDFDDGSDDQDDTEK